MIKDDRQGISEAEKMAKQDLRDRITVAVKAARARSIALFRLMECSDASALRDRLRYGP